jgi:hypothetical protein
MRRNQVKNCLALFVLLSVSSAGCSTQTAPSVSPTAVRLEIIGSVNTMRINDVLQLRVIATFSDKSVSDVSFHGNTIWNSALPGVASMSLGMITAKSVGSTLISVHYGAVSASFILNVTG